ncbi:V-set domain-containing T-cell activation inhibitor 1-like [Labeo rohita]|uniref:V-set domain-containing T-cell activation inhibitor 1-like n=1 Tax=Labeo rohita TaxID=84645 RepID=UPI0021E2875A|nr:V-set domain-containing T-cell activation inhibitor 1-like [Labeo rohita]
MGSAALREKLHCTQQKTHSICWFIYLILHLIDKASLQDPPDILGVVGGSVILSCSYQERVLKPEEINVFWRYNENIIVYNIEKGIPSTKGQNGMFQQRIKSFRSEYPNGNFSLRLSNLKLTDKGQFSCSIPGVFTKHKVRLLVRGMWKQSLLT